MPSRNCDLCGDGLKASVLEDGSVSFDCFMHPFWQERQLLCEKCASTSVRSCEVCDLKDHQGKLISGFCADCRNLHGVVDFREAHAIREGIVRRMVSNFDLSREVKMQLSRIPIKLKDGLIRNGCIFGYCSIEEVGISEFYVKEIYITKGLPRILMPGILAHELFHALVAILTTAASGALKHVTVPMGIAADELEEIGCHLMAIDILDSIPAESPKEVQLRELWRVKLGVFVFTKTWKDDKNNFLEGIVALKGAAKNEERDFRQSQ